MRNNVMTSIIKLFRKCDEKIKKNKKNEKWKKWKLKNENIF